MTAASIVGTGYMVRRGVEEISKGFERGIERAIKAIHEDIRHSQENLRGS